MFLRAISKFSCRGHEYLVDETFEIDDEKARHLIAQKFAVEVPSETTREELSAKDSIPEADASLEDRDLEKAPAVPSQQLKKKKR